MNTKNIASFAIVTALGATASLNATAGELYGGLDDRLNAGTTQAMATKVNTGVANEGALYAEVDAALAAPAVTTAVRPVYRTQLAVGGELGYPQGSSPAARTIGNQVLPTAVAE